MSRARVGGGYFVGVLALLFTAFVGSLAKPDAAGAQPSVMLAQGNCGYCSSCFLKHRVLGVGQGQGFAGLHDTCESGSCAETHGTCEVTFRASQRAPAIYAAVTSASPKSIQDVIRQLGGDVRVNRERGSIQVEGCDKTIALNIPLPPHLFAALDASAESR